MHADSPRLSLAPMMERTDRHFRFLFRLITRRTLLYTEMVTTAAILRGDRRRLLEYDACQHPIALQLGGDDPAALAASAKIAVEQFGYDEINLNVGCPSDRVQGGGFGACLMLDPPRVRDCVAAMRDAVGVPVTVKHRIGVDDKDHYDDMRRFVDTVAGAGCRRFSVHARKAWLSGLSPKENRTIPPLRYDEVYRLKRERPDLVIELNGGILTLEAAHAQLEHVDAVMIGRYAYDRPYDFAAADRLFFGDDTAPLSREQVIAAFVPYVVARAAEGHRVHAVVRHALGLYAGFPGTGAWKRTLGALACRPDATADVLWRAFEAAEEAGRSLSNQSALREPTED
jgi:tRNA-dihydrouridine synthase A